MSRMVDLTRTHEDHLRGMLSSPEHGPDVPPGLCICLTERELDALGLDDDVEVDDLLHLRVMAQATAVHKDGMGVRIEMAIIHGTVEDEDLEPDDD